VRLFFDENLSPRLVSLLFDVYPESVHAHDVGLASATDEAVWSYARQNGCIICTKDSDFHERSLLLGHPPKVVWIRRGNCSTKEIEGLLRNHAEDVQRLAEDEGSAFLMIL
jgi:predicted nuclease of predicted toxin-antitoxin system